MSLSDFAEPHVPPSGELPAQNEEARPLNRVPSGVNHQTITAMPARVAIVSACALVIGILQAGLAAAKDLDPERTRAFVVGKLFAYTCFDGTAGLGRIFADGSVVGTIRLRGEAETRFEINKTVSGEHCSLFYQTLWRWKKVSQTECHVGAGKGENVKESFATQKEERAKNFKWPDTLNASPFSGHQREHLSRRELGTARSDN